MAAQRLRRKPKKRNADPEIEVWVEVTAFGRIRTRMRKSVFAELETALQRGDAVDYDESRASAAISSDDLINALNLDIEDAYPAE